MPRMTRDQIDKLLTCVFNDPADIMAALVEIGLTPEEIKKYWPTATAAYAVGLLNELDAKDRKIARLTEALQLAINTVECASIDTQEGPTKGQELPWYKTARAALAAPKPEGEKSD